MTMILIFALFGLNIHHSFLYSVTLKGFVYNTEMSLAALLRQNGKTNITKNRDKIKIVIFKKNCDMIFFTLFRVSFVSKDE